jgi:hypothetical protein
MFEELMSIRFKIATTSEGLENKRMILMCAINFMIEVLTGTKLTSDFAIDSLNTIYQENMK